jgi:hypothetical protein
MTILPFPRKLALPFFAYGSFKPGELAFTQIENCLDKPPIAAIAPGSLKVRDGLPLFDYHVDGGAILGFILTFRQEKRIMAYETICRFEPKELYSWKDVSLTSPPVRANLLVGKKPLKGRPHDIEGNEWSFRMDPVFQYGLPIIRETVDTIGKDPFQSSSAKKFEWSRFFRLQMAYLLLWSAMERFSTFAYGPGLGPKKRVSTLGSDPRFQNCVEKRLSNLNREVSDSRDPGTRYLLDEMHPEEAADYLYQVRSNLSHRGKGAFSDGEIVRESLILLLAVIEDMLSLTESSGFK